MITKIVVCDDDKIFLNKIKDSLLSLSQYFQVAISLSFYNNGSDLILFLRNQTESFDLLFLDIDMPGISGLETAKELRQTYPNLIIIFISSFDQYVFQSFEYAPFRYIRKDKLEQELPHALKAAFSVIRQTKDQYFLIHAGQNIFKLHRSDIIFFETISRKICIYFKDGKTLLVTGTIKDFIRRLKDPRFVKIHSGCVINIENVSALCGHKVVLKNGMHRFISRTRKKEVQQSFAEYWGGII